jgi:hypothetical protein
MFDEPPFFYLRLCGQDILQPDTRLSAAAAASAAVIHTAPAAVASRRMIPSIACHCRYPPRCMKLYFALQESSTSHCNMNYRGLQSPTCYVYRIICFGAFV